MDVHIQIKSVNVLQFAVARCMFFSPPLACLKTASNNSKNTLKNRLFLCLTAHIQNESVPENITDHLKFREADLLRFSFCSVNITCGHSVNIDIYIDINHNLIFIYTAQRNFEEHCTIFHILYYKVPQL